MWWLALVAAIVVGRAISLREALRVVNRPRQHRHLAARKPASE
jgi:hypothetical protein